MLQDHLGGRDSEIFMTNDELFEKQGIIKCTYQALPRGQHQHEMDLHIPPPTDCQTRPAGAACPLPIGVMGTQFE